MECLVEHDYMAEEEDELSLTKGDKITDVVKMHEGWWEGTLGVKRGLFPDNFVKIIKTNSTENTIDVFKTGEGDGPKLRQKTGSGPHPRRLKAIFSYAPTQDDELQLDVGDVIDFMDEIEEGWWKGELKGRIGIFPSNFVAELDKDNNVSANGKTPSHDGTNEAEKTRNRDKFIAKNKVIPDIIPAYRTQSKEEDSEAAPKLPPKPVRETARCYYPYFAANDDELSLEEGDIVTIISKECEDEGWWRGELRGKIGVFPDNFVEIITANSPTTSTPTANQSKVTPQERTGNLSRNNSKKEARSPVIIPTMGSTVVDGVGGSKVIKTEGNRISQTKPFGKKEIISPIITKGHAPLSPISPITHAFGGFSIKKEQKSPLSSPTTDSPKNDDLNLNAIERSEKLNHLTASRAKAPKRRPPSAIITREDEQDDFGLTNGSSGTGSTSLPMQTVKEIEHPQLVRKTSGNSNSQTIHVPDGTNSKETSPVPLPPPSTVNKPKQAIPWMTELKLKQDIKKSTGISSPTTPLPPTSLISVPIASNNNNNNNNNNISTVIVSPPAPATITTTNTSSPQQPPQQPSIATVISKAPPLPAKPNIPPLVPPVSPILPPIVPPPLAEKPPTTTISNSTNPINSTKFGIFKRVTSTPLPSAVVNHVPPQNGEWVTWEEHNLLKERVGQLENEIEVLRRQLRSILEERDIKGHIV